MTGFQRIENLFLCCMAKTKNYLGGSTVISDRDKTWFAKKSTKVPRNVAARPPKRSKAEREAFETFVNITTPPELLTAQEVADRKDRRSKARSRRAKKDPPL